MHIMGRLNSADLKIFLLYKKLRTIIINPYNNEKGNSKMRNERRKIELKFILNAWVMHTSKIHKRK